MDGNQSSTSDEEEIVTSPKPVESKGVLSKWTNYIHGWQPRYIVLKEGTMFYYKSESETDYGCRGSVSIQKAQIQPHEFDECRFDVIVSADCVWYLRGENEVERQRWIEELDAHKVAYFDSASVNGLRRHGSALSLMSNSMSLASCSGSKSGRVLKEKILEMETYRDLLVKQVETLQKYFDDCVSTASSTKNDSGLLDLSSSDDDDLASDFSEKKIVLKNSHIPANYPAAKESVSGSVATAVDFRGEALTFKSTTSGVLTTLQHCLDLISQREDAWRKKLDKEVEKRKRVEELYKSSLEELKKRRPKLVVMGGPDFEEGPHSQIGEEEFFDAVEAGLDKLDQEQNYFEKLKHRSSSLNLTTKAISHRLWNEIEKVTMEQLQYARASVEDGVWTLFAEDGEMRMYKREEEVDGLAVDPLKAVHTVKGVTAREMCEHFYDPVVRLEWETTVEQLTVLERISDDTSVILQIHKRIWPATQRDALFWSHIRKASAQMNEDAHDLWIVCNHSTEHSNFPTNEGKFIRVGLTVGMVCQTYLDPKVKSPDLATRDDLTCKITYCAVVNPGGWAPTSALRAVYKREYPKFLKRFTQYVFEKCQEKSIRF